MRQVGYLKGASAGMRQKRSTYTTGHRMMRNRQVNSPQSLPQPNTLIIEFQCQCEIRTAKTKYNHRDSCPFPVREVHRLVTNKNRHQPLSTPLGDRRSHRLIQSLGVQPGPGGWPGTWRWSHAHQQHTDPRGSSAQGPFRITQ